VQIYPAIPDTLTLQQFSVSTYSNGGKQMNIKICKLTPDLVEDYVHFFDTTPHYGSNETKCYCISWCGDNVYHNGDSHWYSSPDERKTHGIQRVRNGSIQGYLAYCDDRIVGWCNANTKADCQECVNYLRTDGGVPVEECRVAEKVKFIFCFAIAPEMQRMGVATQLLEYVCQDAAADCFDFVEAYANEKFTDASHDYTGPLPMYVKCGFSKYAEQEGKVIIRKLLK
jgi:GNAT superfamily N-acetyltransferase